MNLTTGFWMIRTIPQSDPSTKREFVSLFLLQTCWVLLGRGLVFGAETQAYQIALYILTACGLITTTSNTVLYIVDWWNTSSQLERSGGEMLAEMKQSKCIKTPYSFWSHYINILFIRGSTTTRMPANKKMILGSLTLLVPFLLFILVIPHMSTTYPMYPLLGQYTWTICYLLSTIGNVQVFHGTLSVRGRETVTNATNLVLITTLLEVESIRMHTTPHLVGTMSVWSAVDVWIAKVHKNKMAQSSLALEYQSWRYLVVNDDKDIMCTMIQHTFQVW